MAMDFSGAFAPPNKAKKPFFEWTEPYLDDSYSEGMYTPKTGLEVSPTNAAYIPPGSRPTSVPTGKSAYTPPAPSVDSIYGPPGMPKDYVLAAHREAAPPNSTVAPTLGRQTSPDIVKDIYAPQLNSVTEKLNAAYNAPHAGTLRQVLGGILTGMNPRNPIGGLVSGEAQRQRNIQPLEEQYKLLSGAITGNRAQSLQDAQIENFKSEADLRKHQGANLDSEVYARQHPNLVPKEEEWSVVPGVEGPNGEPLQQEKHSGQVRVSPLQGASRVSKDTEGALTDIDINGQNHKALIDKKTGKVIADVGRSKLPTLNPATNDNRLDRSYQYNNNILEKARKPIDDRVERLDRAVISVNQKSPQADSLVAPELLTVMAGGQGSGLRMNEAEISRIVGGRSNWESLKAAANKWQTDPTKALSITDSQRGDILKLLTEVKTKATKKQAAIDAASQELIGANDVGQHRSIVQKAHKSLTDIDNSAADSTTSTGGKPPGATHTGIGSVDKKKHWLDASGKDLGPAE